MDRIVNLTDIDYTTTLQSTAASKTTRYTQGVPTSFEEMLTASVKKVNKLQIEADNKVQALAIGEVEDISEVALASSRAEIALRLLMEIRNKFLDAYQTLSRVTG